MRQIERFGSIQVMRGAAALLVVVLHAAGTNASLPNPGPTARVGAIGVDLFFVISGFVMAHTMARTTPGFFLALRAARILPTWYAFLAAEVAVLLLVGVRLTPEGWANSLALLPVASGQTYEMPFLAAGWTLGFEAAFYMVVAAVMIAGRGPRTLLVAMLALAAMPDFSPWAVGRWFTNDILLEFAFGVLAFLTWHRIDGRIAVALGLTGAAALGYQLAVDLPDVGHVAAVTSGELAAKRALVWGLPCLLIFLAVVRWTPGSGPVARAALAVGDASYSIYLSHHMVMWPVLALLPGWTGAAVGIPLAVGMGWWLHRLVEIPLTAWARRRVGQQRAVATVAP